MENEILEQQDPFMEDSIDPVQDSSEPETQTADPEPFIGEIFLETYPPQIADWCLENNAYIQEIDPIIEEGREIRRFEIKAILIPTPTPEEQKKNREAAYERSVDPITAHIERLKDEEQTEEIILKIAQLKQERNEKVQEIRNRYPID